MTFDFLSRKGNVKPKQKCHKAGYDVHTLKKKIGFISVSGRVLCDYCGCPPARHENLVKKSRKNSDADSAGETNLVEENNSQSDLSEVSSLEILELEDTTETEEDESADSTKEEDSANSSTLSSTSSKKSKSSGYCLHFSF